MPVLLDRLRGRLIVSCQPVEHGPFDHPDMVAAFAQAALDGGASGLRIEGVANLRAVRSRVPPSLPVIGLIKQDLADTQVRITPLLEHVRALAAEGADVIAFDATDRVRPVSVDALCNEVQRLGVLAMADCASFTDAQRAHELGCAVLGSTLSGYLGGAIPDEPDIELVRKLSTLPRFVIAEGRYHTPSAARLAIQAGADAVVAGSAITRPEHITAWFVAATGNLDASVVPAAVS